MVLLQKLVPSQKIDAELVVRNSCGELGEMSMSNQAVRKVVLLFPNEQCRQYLFELRRIWAPILGARFDGLRATRPRKGGQQPNKPISCSKIMRRHGCLLSLSAP